MKNKKSTKVKEALLVVCDLAEQNALDERCDPPLSQEAKRQRIALDVVYNFIANKGGII